MIDDEPAMHYIVRHMASKIDGVDLVGSFQETSKAFAFIEENQVDLAIIDISMPNENGLDFARRIRKMAWQGKIIFLTSHKEFALPAFDVFAYDYIVKPLSQKRLTATLERAFAEMTLIDGNPEEPTLEDKRPELIEPLTKRENEILSLICDGLSNKEIAETYKLTEGTIKNHVVNIFGKLQVKNRVQATLVAKSLKII